MNTWLNAINPNLYAALPPGKKEEYKALFHDPVKIRYPVCTSDGWIWCNEEHIIPEKEPVEKLLSIRYDSPSDIKLVSSLPEFGSEYSMYNQKDVHRGLNGEEWLIGARPFYGF